ncbi:MAG: sigma-70 family RNA polymerase sigma factor [Tepidisphaeraceae bacterium]
METDTDADLLDRFARDGDRPALDALVRRYVDFVYATARREVDPHLADDVTQAAFLLLASKARSVPRYRVGGWLFRATRYCAANARRGEQRRLKHERAAARERPEETPVRSTTHSNDPESLLPQLNDALDSLGQTDREAIVLRYLRGQEVLSVANSLGMNESTARKRISRAIEKLRQAFARRGAKTITSSSVAGVLVLASTKPAPAATVAAVSSIALSSTVASPVVASLSAGATKMMFTSKAKLVAGLLVASTLATGVGMEAVRRMSAGVVLAAAPSSDPTLVGTLGSGASVELVAVRTVGANGTDWRRPDGAAFTGPLPAGLEGLGGDQTEGTQFALRISGDERSITTVRLNAPIDGLSWRPASKDSLSLVTYPRDLTAPVTLRCAVGPTVPQDSLVVRIGEGPASGGVPQLGRCTLTAVADAQGKAESELDIATREHFASYDVVAIAANGKEVRTTAVTFRDRPGDTPAEVHIFDVPLASLQEFHLRVRPADGWVEFQDVAPTMGRRTDPKVTTQDKSVAVGDDIKAMQGTWRVVSAQDSGRDAPADEVAKARFVIEGDVFRMIGADGRGDSARFTVDPAHDPKWLDFIPLNRDGTPSSVVLQGLYKLSGDDLEIVMPEGNGKAGRSSAFRSEPSSPNDMHFVLRRGEPATTAPTTATPFAAFAQRLTGASSVQVDVKATTVQQGQTVAIVGSMKLAAGGRKAASFDIDQGAGQPKMNMLAVSDGRQNRSWMNGQANPSAGRVEPTETAVAMIARLGVAGSFFMATVQPAGGEVKPIDVEKEFPIRNLKETTAPIDGVDRPALTFDVEMVSRMPQASPNMTYHQTLWLDPTTGLPIRRETVAPHGSAQGTIVETYSNWKLNEPIAAEAFDVNQTPTTKP